MNRVLILSTDTYVKSKHEHILFITNSFIKKGWVVYLAKINTLSIEDDIFFADGVIIKSSINVGDSFEDRLEKIQIDSTNLGFLMGFPHPMLEVEIYQMLWLLSKKIKFVNSIESLSLANNKVALSYFVPKKNRPETYTSNNFEYLWNIVVNSNKNWVAKPINGFYGADVYKIGKNISNSKVILESLTGNQIAYHELYNKNTLGLINRYCVLQEYISTIKSSEKRIVMAFNRVIGTACKKQQNSLDHRGKVNQGGKFLLSDITKEELKLCKKIGSKLLDNGLVYIGIDISYPYIVEINSINPGGVSYLEELSDINYTDEIVDIILENLSKP